MTLRAEVGEEVLNNRPVGGVNAFEGGVDDEYECVMDGYIYK